MNKPHVILGVSGLYHDSAAAILVDGVIVAAAQEERFTRKKQDSSFPIHAIKYVLQESGFELSDVTDLAFYDKPYIKFERLLETYHAYAPLGLISFLQAMPIWIKEKLFLKHLIKEKLAKIGIGTPNILFPEHHLSHSASAFFPSPFEDAAILTLDGVGEWATTTIGHGQKNTITLLDEIRFPHSLGLLYSAFTYYCGFKVNSGEYKLMGLAPYGNSSSEQTKEYKKKILEHIVDIRKDGSFLLNLDYFNYTTGLTMTKDKKWKNLFGIDRRKPESILSQDYMNLALAIQEITEKIVIMLAHTAKEKTKSNYLVLAGGVALNCVANGKLLREKIFDDIWIQPAAGDAGGALGAALAVWHISHQKIRNVNPVKDSMQGTYLGPQFSDIECKRVLRKSQAPAHTFKTDVDLLEKVASYLNKGAVVGWFDGRMEFGPRALCHRSILGDPRQPDMQKKLNLKIKFREGFRPFAPVCKEEKVSQYFQHDRPSPYMLYVAPINTDLKKPEPENFASLPMHDRLYHVRSTLPAITHIDYSARIQTINKETNNRFWMLLDAFESLTNTPILVNTSFNVRGEPIVCTPTDAYQCFMRTEMDILVLGNFILLKQEQPKWTDTQWQNEFLLD